MATPNRADPVEELNARRDADQKCHEGKEGKQDLTRSKHVVCPDRDGEGSDCDSSCNQPFIAKDRLTAKDWKDLCDDAEEGQSQDIDLWVAKEPE